MNVIRLPASVLPDEPDWSALYSDVTTQSRAHHHWHDIVSAMAAAGVSATGHIIFRTVTFRLAYDDAHLDVAANGRIQKARRTGVPVVNPNWTAMRQASKILSSLEAKLGLVPRRRGVCAPNLYP